MAVSALLYRFQIDFRSAHHSRSKRSGGDLHLIDAHRAVLPAGLHAGHVAPERNALCRALDDLRAILVGAAERLHRPEASERLSRRAAVELPPDARGAVRHERAHADRARAAEGFQKPLCHNIRPDGCDILPRLELSQRERAQRRKRLVQCLPRFSRALILAAFPVEERTGKFPQPLCGDLHRAFHDTGAHAHLALCKKREKRTSSAAQPVSAPDAPVVPGEQSALHRGDTRIRRFLRRKHGNEHAAGFFQRADDRGITFTVYGLDEHYNRIEIPAEQVTLDAVGVEGTWNGYSFTPKTSGTFTVIATYNNLVAYQQNVVSGKVARLSPTNASIKLNKAGETATIAMNAYDQDGFSYWASTSTNYSVADESVGTVSGNVFTAKKTGATYIKCEKDGAIAYITVTVGNAAAVKAPAAAAVKDALNQTVTVANDGAHYFNVAGKLAYTGTNKIDAAVYTSAREKAKAYVDANASVAIYGGKNDLQTANKVDSLTWNGSYRFLNRGGVSVAMLSAAKGGITATNPSQWASFTRDIDAANNSTVVLVMDKTPSAFSSAAETNYFRAILSKYVEQGKRVFVISCGSTSYWTSTKDGVRYINLPDLWKADGTVNPNYKMLRFRVKDGAVTYEAVHIK